MAGNEAMGYTDCKRDEHRDYCIQGNSCKQLARLKLDLVLVPSITPCCKSILLVISPYSTKNSLSSSSQVL